MAAGRHINHKICAVEYQASLAHRTLEIPAGEVLVKDLVMLHGDRKANCLVTGVQIFACLVPVFFGDHHGETTSGRFMPLGDMTVNFFLNIW